MNIKSAFSIFLTAFMLCSFFTSAPAQSAPMPEAAGRVAEDLTVDVFVIEIEEDPVKERIIFEQDVIEDVRTFDGTNAPNAIAPLIKPSITKPPRVDPYAVIEAARHSKGDRRAYSLQDIQQLRGRLDMAVVDAKSRLPELKKIGLSPVEKLCDRLNQMQQTITLKVSNLLERVGRSANDTAQQLRESS